MRNTSKGRFVSKGGRVRDKLTQYPDSKKKESCIYIDGEISHAAHGIYKVEADNGMEIITTSSMLDHRKVGLLMGDRVTCEIPALSLNPTDKIKGRIVFRHRSS